MAQVHTALWRRAHEPVSAHELATALLDEGRYARTRGVAQQAARLARAARLDRDPRRRLLAAAWLHDLGPAGRGWEGARDAARALRRAGQEPLARLVAHTGNLPMAAAFADHPPLAREFPAPTGVDATLLILLDVALLTTRVDGAPGTPLDALRDRAQRVPAGDPGVRALVALVARVGEDAAARALVERLSRGFG